MKVETRRVGDNVVTCSCRLATDSMRWEPLVSVHPANDPAGVHSITVKPEEFQDSPEDAMRLAGRLADAWLIENKPDDGTADAAA